MKPSQLLKAAVVVAMMFATKTAMSQQPITLRSAIDMALMQNHTLRSDSLGVLETAYKNKETAGRLLPQISYNNSAEYNIALPSQLLPGEMLGQPSKDLVPVKFGTNYSIRSGVEVNQTLLRKDLIVQKKAAPLYISIAKTKYNLSKEDVVYQVAAAYYNLQATQEMIRTTTRDYENIAGVLHIAKAQFDNGTLKKIDYQTLQINLANKQSQLNSLETQYKEQLAWFNYLLGLPANEQTIINENIASVNGLELPENQLDLRQDLHLSRQMILSKEVDIKSVQAEKSPAISSFFRYNLQSQFNNVSNAFSGDYTFKSSTAGISVSLSIFDGNRRKSRLRAAQIQLEQLRLQDQQLQDHAQTEWVTALRTFDNNRHQLQITDENLVLAEQVFASRKALYTEGVSSLIELLDADRELSSARNYHTQAIIDVQKAWLDVHKANGTLLSNFLKSL